MGCKGSDWPYAGTIDIVKKLGHTHVEVAPTAHSYDQKNKILCTPCYMCGKSTPFTVYKGISTMIIEAQRIMKKDK